MPGLDGESLTLEEVEEETREILGVTEKASGTWHGFCSTMLRITREQNPDVEEETVLLALTKIAILDHYIPELYTR